MTETLDMYSRHVASLDMWGQGDGVIWVLACDQDWPEFLNEVQQLRAP